MANPKKKKKASTPQGNAEIKDDRFSGVHFDPRFKILPKNKSKVKIDSRFKSMFTDSRFSTSQVVDKYGRANVSNVKEDLHKFYHLEEKDDEKSPQPETGSNIDAADSVDENELENIPDYSRGKYLLSSSSSSSEESDEEELSMEADPGEVSEDARQAEQDVPLGEPSKRLAICNMDWDNLKAVDIFAILNSFKPSAGVIHSVKIYPSDYGKTMMEEESKYGPASYLNSLSGSSKTNHDSSVECEQMTPEECIRSYQLQRLKYFYAVAECDSIETAEVIYNQCDGMEFEYSSNQFDLRYIPDDMDFEGASPSSVALEVPLNYQPSEFCTTALQHSRSKITWDEPDKDRQKVISRHFSKKDLLEVDFRAYLASSGDESDNDSISHGFDHIEYEGEEYADSPSQVDYQKVIQELKDEKQAEEEAKELEITFEAGLVDAAQNLVKKKLKKDSESDMTVWDKYLQKKKDLKKQRKKEKLSKAKEEDGDDEYIPNVDMNDSFFKDFSTASSSQEMNAKKSGKSQKKKAESTEEEQRERAELQLLLLNENQEEPASKHFNFKEIVKSESKVGKKQKSKSTDPAETDAFTLDLDDKRFKALYESHHFAIDPTNPQFKKTKQMDRILKERQVRNYTEDGERKIPLREETPSNTNQTHDSELDRLVKSIKRKSNPSFDNKSKKLYRPSSGR